MCSNQIRIISERDEVKHYMERYPFHHLLNRFREPEKQQQVLYGVLSPEVTMCLAVTDQLIIGYTIVLWPEEEERWTKLDFIRVLGVIEIAPAYRGKGLAKQLIQRVVSPAQYDDKIIVSLEYYWHWDLELTKGDAKQYQMMLKSMLSWSGFEEYSTDEPDIAGYPYNFMMARIGKDVTNEKLHQFMKLAHPHAIP